jgi:hypothetical protein
MLRSFQVFVSHDFQALMETVLTALVPGHLLDFGLPSRNIAGQLLQDSAAAVRLISVAAAAVAEGGATGLAAGVDEPLELQGRCVPLIMKAIEEVMGALPIVPSSDIPLADHGLTSQQMFRVSRHLSESLGIQVPLTLLFDYPTLHAIKDYLLGEEKHVVDVPVPRKHALETAVPDIATADVSVVARVRKFARAWKSYISGRRLSPILQGLKVVRVAAPQGFVASRSSTSQPFAWRLCSRSYKACSQIACHPRCITKRRNAIAHGHVNFIHRLQT